MASLISLCFRVSFCSLAVSEGKCNRFDNDLSKALYESVVAYMVVFYVAVNKQSVVLG